MGDFNAEPADTALSDFENPNNPSCTDLIITNRWKSFQNSMVTETYLNFRKCVLR